MKLSNQELLNFVGRIKLTEKRKKKYTKQIDNLVQELQTAISKHTDMKVTSVLRAGSWKKGTALRPYAGAALDIDLVFFLDVEEASSDDINTLHDTLLEFLLKAYPTKEKEDFTSGEKTVGLKFRGSGLEADLVPVIQLQGDPEYVWQPSKRKGAGKFITNVRGQLTFARDLKAEDSNYTSIVRIAKAWRRRQELSIPSFAIELIVAHLVLTEGRATNIEDAVVRFFEFVSRSEFPEITFPEAKGDVDEDSKGPVYIADPTYNPNNVLERKTQEQWDEAIEAAQIAFETLTFAQSKRAQGETLSLWKEIMGPEFNIEPEEEAT